MVPVSAYASAALEECRKSAFFFFFLLEEESFIDYRNALARLQRARAGLPQRLTVSSDAGYTR
jgi:hypothetical protein